MTTLESFRREFSKYAAEGDEEKQERFLDITYRRLIGERAQCRNCNHKIDAYLNFVGRDIENSSESDEDEKSLQLSETIVEVLNEMATHYREKGDWESTRALSRTLAMEMELLGMQNTENYAASVFNHAAALLNTAHLEEAKKRFMDSLALFQKLPDTETQQCESLTGMAMAAIGLERKEEAGEALAKAEKLLQGGKVEGPSIEMVSALSAYCR